MIGGRRRPHHQAPACVACLALIICHLATFAIGQVGEAPIDGTDTDPASTLPPTSSTNTPSTATTTIPLSMAAECATSILGIVWSDEFLIQRATNVSSEDGCCMACQSFQYCGGWSYYQDDNNDLRCNLYSVPVEGPVPTGTSMTSWVSGQLNPPALKTYDCSSPGSSCYACTASIGTCRVCGNRKYLLAGECVDDCAVFGYINYGRTRRGRECVPPFTCSSTSCSCPSADFGEKCTQCRFAFGAEQQCLQCEETEYLVQGRCQNEITCRRYNFEELPSTPCNCRTSENKNNCFQCTHKGGFMANPPEKFCTRCRNSKYLIRDTGLCVEDNECPEGKVPTNAGLYGRECLPPSVCVKGKNPETRADCSCFQKTYCHTCSFNEDGYACLKCRGGRFLLDGSCVETCPQTHAHANTRTKYNRICSPETLVCDDSVSSLDGSACNCRDKRCKVCTYTIGNSANESQCNQCKSGYALNNDGACVRQ